jgi:hypothetical protein
MSEILLHVQFLKDMFQPKKRGVNRGTKRFTLTSYTIADVFGYCLERQGLSIGTPLDPLLLLLDNTFKPPHIIRVWLQVFPRVLYCVFHVFQTLTQSLVLEIGSKNTTGIGTSQLHFIFKLLVFSNFCHCYLS